MGYSIFTPVFEKIDGTTNTLADIIVCNPDGVEFDNKSSFSDPEEVKRMHVSAKKISVRKLKNGAFVAAGAIQYTSSGWKENPADRSATWGWGTAKNTELVSGEGVIVYNDQKTNVIFRVAGQVQLMPGYTVPLNYSVFGNCTPVDIKLGQITVCNSDGVEFDNKSSFSDPEEVKRMHVSAKKISVRKLKNGAFVAGDAIQYTSAGWKENPADRGATWGWGSHKDDIIKSGEAVVIYNDQKIPVIFKLESPIK